MRTIVIARTVATGRKRFPNAVAIATPRSRTAARGHMADRIVILREMKGNPATAALHRDALPALVKSRRARSARG